MNNRSASFYDLGELETNNYIANKNHYEQTLHHQARPPIHERINRLTLIQLPSHPNLHHHQTHLQPPPTHVRSPLAIKDRDQQPPLQNDSAHQGSQTEGPETDADR